MRHLKRGVALLAAAALAGWLGGHPAMAGNGTWVRVLPAAGGGIPGDSLAVEVWVEDVSSLYAADIRLGFDPARLAVVDASPSIPGVQVTPRSDLLSPDLVLLREADNSAGTVAYAVTQINPSEPVTGTGALFAFTVTLLAEGTAHITVTMQQLTTRNAELIPANSSGAVYTIHAPFELWLPLTVRSN